MPNLVPSKGLESEMIFQGLQLVQIAHSVSYPPAHIFPSLEQFKGSSIYAADRRNRSLVQVLGLGLVACEGIILFFFCELSVIIGKWDDRLIGFCRFESPTCRGYADYGRNSCGLA